MNKGDIEDYINKLKHLEGELSSGNDDLSLIGDLDNLLSSLNTDITEGIVNGTGALNVKIKKLHPKAVIPTYSKDGDAGMDLTITKVISNSTYDITYGFGIAMEIPQGYVGLVFPRSSIRKMELLLTNSVGVIDSGYRGEIQATFKKTEGLDGFYYKEGDRAAQIMILPYPKISFIESEELNSSERGDGGFGSTGS